MMNIQVMSDSQCCWQLSRLSDIGDYETYRIARRQNLLQSRWWLTPLMCIIDNLVRCESDPVTVRSEMFTCQVFGPTDAKNAKSAWDRTNIELSTSTKVQWQRRRSMEKACTLEVTTETRAPWAILTRNLPNLVMGNDVCIFNVPDFHLPARYTETFYFPPAKRAAVTWYGDSECKLRYTWPQTPSARNEIQELLHIFIVKNWGIPVTSVSILMESDHRRMRFSFDTGLGRMWTDVACTSGDHVWRILTASRECQTGTFSSSPLEWEWSQNTYHFQGREYYPWMAKSGVSTRFDRCKSLSSGVSEDSRIARNKGSMKCADLASWVVHEEPCGKRWNHLDIDNGT